MTESVDACCFGLADPRQPSAFAWRHAVDIASSVVDGMLGGYLHPSPGATSVRIASSTWML